MAGKKRIIRDRQGHRRSVDEETILPISVRAVKVGDTIVTSAGKEVTLEKKERMEPKPVPGTERTIATWYRLWWQGSAHHFGRDSRITKVFPPVNA